MSIFAIGYSHIRNRHLKVNTVVLAISLRGQLERLNLQVCSPYMGLPIVLSEMIKVFMRELLISVLFCSGFEKKKNVKPNMPVSVSNERLL